MKKVHKIVALVATFVVATWTLIAFQGELAGLFAPVGGGGKGPSDGEGDDARPVTATNITLILDYGNGTVEELRGLSYTGVDPTVFDLLNATCRVEAELYPNGLYLVTGINGVVQDDSHFWHFWVNGTYSPTGASITPLGSSSVVTWKFLGETYLG
ncbi:MAG: hypothetical protein Kow0069_00590 [Promethearchaeota archaeon]